MACKHHSSLEVTSYDAEGEKVAFNQLITFVVGAGGFGGKRSSDKAYSTQKPPSRSADSVLEERTSIDQVLILIHHVPNLHHQL